MVKNWVLGWHVQWPQTVCDGRQEASLSDSTKGRFIPSFCKENAAGLFLLGRLTSCWRNPEQKLDWASIGHALPSKERCTWPEECRFVVPIMLTGFVLSEKQVDRQTATRQSSPAPKLLVDNKTKHHEHFSMNSSWWGEKKHACYRSHEASNSAWFPKWYNFPIRMLICSWRSCRSTALFKSPWYWVEYVEWFFG